MGLGDHKETIKAEAYLVIKAKRGYGYDTAGSYRWGQLTSGTVARATVNKPSVLRKDEVAVKVAVVIPKSCFEPLNLTDAGLLTVPEDHILSPAFYSVPVEDEIAYTDEEGE